MAKIDDELKKILTKYSISPNDKTKLWDCHGTLVLYHKAYEIIAAQENITFDAPQVIQADAHNKMAIVCVTGRMGERYEWSFGEATPYNSKNSYPFAMAEKRAKDRVIAKLVGLAQYVYSEDEADEFKNAKPKEQEQRLSDDEMNLLIKRFNDCQNKEQLEEAKSLATAAKPRMAKDQIDLLVKTIKRVENEVGL